MSSSLTEKRKAAIAELKEMRFNNASALARAIALYTDTNAFAGLADWCQRHFTPSNQLDRVCDALWEG
jgi:hypothetical protein